VPVVDVLVQLQNLFHVRQVEVLHLGGLAGLQQFGGLGRLRVELLVDLGLHVHVADEVQCFIDQVLDLIVGLFNLDQGRFEGLACQNGNVHR